MPRKRKAVAATANLRQKSLLEMFPSSPRSSPHPRSSVSKEKKRLPSNVSSSDSEIALVESPVRSKRPQRTFVKLGANSDDDSDDSNVGRIKFEERSSPNHSGDDGSDAGPSTQVRHAKRRRLLASDSEEKIDCKEEDAESRGVGLIQPRSSRSKQVRVIDSDSDQVQHVKPKRRLVKGVRPPSEEEDILDGIHEDKIIESRLRGRSTKQSRYLKNLEKLKKKKRGETTSASDESEGEVSEETDPQVTIPGARPGWGEVEDEDEDEDEEDIEGFIVEDDGNTQTANLPAAFSMNTHQDLAHHFKIVCQYHVHLAIANERRRKKVAKQLTEDEYFSVPLTITRRKLTDLRDTIASSVWRPAYKKALQKFPEFHLNMLDFAIPQCDACHLGGRMSKFVARLRGSPYDRNTFEALRVSSSDESDSGKEDLSQELHLGRWCAKRTEIFHELCHWEYKLFETLTREITELSRKKRGSSAIVYSCEPPKDPTDGDEVMDWLDRREIISIEWESVKDLITRASNLDADARRGNADD